MSLKGFAKTGDTTQQMFRKDHSFSLCFGGNCKWPVLEQGQKSGGYYDGLSKR